jgi:hypothetical protein
MAVDPTKTTPPANIEPGDVEETGVVEQKTRIQKVKEEHQKRANERANNQNELKVSYKKIMNEPAFKDILVKGKQFAAYHLTLAKDGVGYQQTGSKDDSGNELDKAAGIEELSSYIERQISEEALNPSAPKKIVS